MKSSLNKIDISYFVNVLIEYFNIARTTETHTLLFFPKQNVGKSGIIL